MQTEDIISHIQNTKNQIVAQLRSINSNEENFPKCAFITIWDFDGTILKGDCSEGLQQQGKTLYPGFVEYAIKNGLSKKFQGKQGFDQFWQEYKKMEQLSHEQAYIFMPQAFAGQKVMVLEEHARQHFQTMKDYYFVDSLQILQKLQSDDIYTIVISASADFIVRAGSSTVGIPERHLYGIEMETELEMGSHIVTEKPILPITYGTGKTHKMNNIISQMRKDYDQIFVLAGFGNSYHTDGYFLKAILEQKIPKGKPISIMINGGTAPQTYENQFIEIEYKKTIADQL